MHVSLNAPTLILLGAILFAGPVACSESRITWEFDEIAEARCGELMNACSKEMFTKCACTHEVRKTENPSAPYEASITLARLVKTPGRKQKKWARRDVYDYMYKDGAWVESGVVRREVIKPPAPPAPPAPQKRPSW